MWEGLVEKDILLGIGINSDCWRNKKGQCEKRKECDSEKEKKRETKASTIMKCGEEREKKIGNVVKISEQDYS